MNKRIPSFDEFMSEGKIGNLVDDIKIEIEIDTTVLAEERKFRHTDEGGDVITNQDILDTTQKAIEEIGERQLKGIDTVGKQYCISNAANNLNVVANLTRKNNELILVVITVMRKKGFKEANGAYKIIV